MDSPTTPPEEARNYGGTTRSEWLAAMKQTKTGDEAMALMMLAPVAPPELHNPPSWIDETLDADPILKGQLYGEYPAP